MNPKLFWLTTAIVLAYTPTTEAQQPQKMARIGYLSARSGPFPALQGFEEGLREFGWIEGKQIAIEYRYAGADPDSWPSLRRNLFV